MVAPFVVLLPWLTGAMLATAGHVVMVAAMVVLMAVRWPHYSTAPTWAPVLRRARPSAPVRDSANDLGTSVTGRVAAAAEASGPRPGQRRRPCSCFAYDPPR